MSDEEIPQDTDGGDAVELPDENEDLSAYMKEFDEYRESAQEDTEEAEHEEKKNPSRARLTRVPTQSELIAHTNFWFVWEDVPGKDDAAFLKQLGTIIDQYWVLEATVEKSSIETTLTVTRERDDKIVHLEVQPDQSSLMIFDKDGEPLLELTARVLEGRTYCFSSLLCNMKWFGKHVCFGEALAGGTKCQRHAVSLAGRKPGTKIIGGLAVKHVDTGHQCLPADAYYYWRKKKPEIAHFIDDLVESFRLKVNWDPSHPLMNELRYICVQMVSRDLMHNKAISADFKSAVRDPDTGQIVAFKAHYLLNNITTFDARISQKLKDFGLLVPPSRTENPHKIPVELELLWTPLKKAGALDVSAKVIESQEQEKKETENAE